MREDDDCFVLYLLVSESDHVHQDGYLRESDGCCVLYLPVSESGDVHQDGLLERVKAVVY